MIVEHLYKGVGRPREPLRPGVLRMSGVEGCQRRLAYTQLGHEEGEVDDRRTVVMQDGNLHEQDIVRRLLAQGFQVWNYGSNQLATRMEFHHLVWSGHPDLFIRIDDVVRGLEVKAFRDEAFDKYALGAKEVKPGIFVISDPNVLAARPWPVMGQVQSYLHSDAAVELGIEEWFVVIKNKNTAELAECLIPKMPEYINQVTQRWVGFWGYVSVRKLPPRAFASNTPECKLCPFFKKCWGTLAKLPQKVKDLSEDGGLQERVAYWREGLKLRKSAELRIEYAKLGLSKAAEEHQAGEVAVDGFHVVFSERSRRGLDKENVEELLRQLRHDGLITKEQWDACFTKTEYLHVRPSDWKAKK